MEINILDVEVYRYRGKEYKEYLGAHIKLIKKDFEYAQMSLKAYIALFTGKSVISLYSEKTNYWLNRCFLQD